MRALFAQQSISTKTLAVLAFTMIAFGVITFGISRSVVTSGFQDLEDREAALNVDRALAGFSAEISDLNTIAGGIASADAITALLSAASTGLDTNQLSSGFFAQVAIDGIVVVDTDGRVRYEKHVDLRSGETSSVVPRLIQQVSMLSALENMYTRLSEKGSVEGLLSQGVSTGALTSAIEFLNEQGQFQELVRRLARVGALRDLVESSTINPSLGAFFEGIAQEYSLDDLMETIIQTQVVGPDYRSRIASGLLGGDEPILFVQWPIFAAVRSGDELLGSILIARTVTPALGARIAERTQTDIQVLSVARGDVPPVVAEQLSRLGTESIRVQSSGSTQIYETLIDAAGANAIVVALTLPRDIVAQGAATQRYLLAGLVGVGIFTTVVFAFVLRWLILIRITRLHRELESIASAEGGLTHVTVIGDDEIAGLAAQVNSTLESLSGAEASVRIRTERLSLLALLQGTVISGSGLPEALGNIASRVRSFTGADLVAIEIYGDEGMHVIATETAAHERLMIRDGARHSASLELTNPRHLSDEEVNLVQRALSISGFPNIFAVPMPYRDTMAGVIDVCWTGRHDLAAGDIEILREVGNQAAIAVRSIADHEELEQLARNLEDRVQERTSELNAIIASMVDGLLVIDAAQHIAYMNPAHGVLFGVDPKLMIGAPLSQFRDTVQHNMRPVADSQRTLFSVLDGHGHDEYSFEMQIATPNPIQVLVQVFSIPGPNGDLTGVLTRDVTGERTLDDRRDTFISITSHELRTPMATAMGFIELLLTMDPGPEVRKEWLGDILRNMKRLTDIVDKLLNVSRIRSGKMTIDTQGFALASVVDEIVPQIQTLTTRHEFHISVPNQLNVRADRDKLVQVLFNLVENAVKYSPNGGSVTILATSLKANNRVRVAVIDQGMGIAMDQADLFKPFVRITRAETESIGGTGLGLYIVKELVEAMGGEIGFESQLNIGTTFWFTLPEWAN